MSIERMMNAGRVASVTDPHLQQLLDKQACAEVMMTYCRAIDHLDEVLLRSVFFPDSYHRHGFEGPSTDPSRPSRPGKPGDFVAYALGVLNTHTRTHHQLGNVFIEIEADGVTAYTEAYFTACHRMRAKGDPKAATNAYDTEMDFRVGGRYMDRMEKREGVWKIAYRVGITDWMRTDPPTSQGYFGTPAELQSHQSREDMLYRRRSAFRQSSAS
jgi:SnoaL-like domain